MKKRYQKIIEWDEEPDRPSAVLGFACGLGWTTLLTFGTSVLVSFLSGVFLTLAVILLIKCQGKGKKVYWEEIK